MKNPPKQQRVRSNGVKRGSLFADGSMQLKPSAPEAFESINVDDYLTILAIIANADAVLRTEELAFFESRMARMLINPNMRSKFRQLLKMEFDIDAVARKIDKRTLRLALRDGIFLAAADGEIHPAEVDVVRIIAHHAEVDEERLHEIWSWVKEGITWMAQGPRLTEVPLHDK